MKKILFAFVLLLAIVLVFASCGGEDKPSGNDTPVHTHEFAEWDLTKKPTCTEDGIKVRYCSCGEKQSEVVVSLGHTPAEAVVEDRVEPTYEKDGSYNLVVRCTTCNEKLTESSHTIPMLKHTPALEVTENYVATTCYAEGSYDSVIYCSDCGAELERTKHTIEKTAHTPASAVEENLVDSTCYSVGSKEMVVYCAVSECRAFIEKSTVSIDKKAHTPATAVEENRVNPTYEKAGSYQMVVYCSMSACHAELERTTHTLDMLVHHPGNAVVENKVEATCTKNGSYDEVIYCLDADCGYKELSRKNVIIDIIPHTSGSAVEENRTNATCYAEGKYDSVVCCAVCNTELSRTTVTLQKIAHSPATAVVENRVEATCTTNGSYDEVVYCGVENCKVQISRANKILAATGHAEVVDPAVEATCTETGLTEGKHCGVCNEVIEEQSVVNVVEHNYVDNVCTVCGNEYFSQGLEFSLNADGTYSVMGIGTCADTELIIPAYNDGLPVTRIGKDAFRENKTIKSLTTGRNVVVIDKYAFYNCASLVDLKMEDSLTTIDEYAFANCSSLTNVKAGKNISSFVLTAFYVCFAMSNIEVDEENQYYSSIEGSLYDKSGTVLFRYAVGKTDTNFTVPDNVKSINEQAFYGAKNLINVIITDEVTNIEEGAFGACSSLTSVTIGSSVRSIEVYAFYDCIDLTTINFNGSVDDWKVITKEFGWDYSTGNYIVYCDDGKITKGGIVTYYEVSSKGLEFTSNGNGTCYVSGIGSCTDTEIIIPTKSPAGDTVTSIYDYAFRDCLSITSISMSDNVINIGKGAFYGCSNLASIVIPKNIITIGEFAFYNCKAVESIYFNATNMNDLESCNCVFYSAGLNGDGITVIVGAGVERIPSYLFNPYDTQYKAPKITNIIWEEGSCCKEMGDYIISYCPYITQMVIPESVTILGIGSLYGCENLEELIFENPNGWYYITSFGEKIEAPVAYMSNSKVIARDSIYIASNRFYRTE